MKCHTMAIVLTTIVLTLPSCEKEASSQTAISSKYRIQEARELLQKMNKRFPNNSELGRTERILNEPDFTGVVKEWGCLTSFDNSGNIVKAYTLKVKDFTTGQIHNIRKYTEAELIEAEPQILAYKKKMGIRENYPIPALSESMKLAVAVSLLNENPSLTYALRRGEGNKKHEFQVIKIQGNLVNVVAADALYPTQEDLPP